MNLKRTSHQRKKLFNKITQFIFGILFLAQASKLLELEDNQNQLDHFSGFLDIIQNDHPIDAFMNIEDSVDIIDDDDSMDAFMDVEKNVDIEDNDVKDAECRNEFMKIIGSILLEDENEKFDNDKKITKKHGFNQVSKYIRKLCFSFLCRTDISAVYLAFGKHFQEEFWALFQNEWDYLRRKKALAAYEKNLKKKEIIGPILGGFMGSTTTSQVTIQNLLKKYPNISSWVRRFPLSARCKFGDDASCTDCYHFNSYDKENCDLSFTDGFGVRLVLNLGDIGLRTLVMDEEMPDIVLAKLCNPDRMSSQRVKEVRFVFVNIEKIKKMINESEL